MKTLKKFIAFILFAITLTGVYAQKTNDSGNTGYLKYYRTGYGEAREAFREKALQFKAKYPGSIFSSVKVPSKIDTDLTVDLFFIPGNSNNEKLMILSSGVHGIEGYAGSAVQLMFFDKFLTDSLLNKTGILFIHAVNPYGFKYNRRVSENNVDLNRNSSVDSSLYSIVNDGYVKVYDFINPKSKLNTKSFGNVFFDVRAVFKILKASMPVLRQAILQGQYQYPEGLYYGGKTFEPQIKALYPVLKDICEPYQTVFETDLHTGYGERGKLHFFPNPTDSITKTHVENIFSGYRVDWGDTKDFYTVTGDFVDFIGQINKGKEYIPMTFEYGTLNSQTTGGSLKSIHIMINENQGFHYGYKKPRDQKKSSEDFIEMYFPSDTDWRIKILKDTETMYRHILPVFLNGNF